LRDLVGSERMLMGSDYPHLLGSIDRAVTSIEGLGLPSEESARILGGNALRILVNTEAALRPTPSGRS
ncbi:MAG TPA: amidohydrolase family protein, partial [Vicinamibacteria bacterium]